MAMSIPRFHNCLWGAFAFVALVATVPLALAHEPASGGAGPHEWISDLAPISAADWTFERAAHLLERAGFGGTPEDIQRLADMTPAQAVRTLVHYESIDNSQLRLVDESGVFDPCGPQ